MGELARVLTPENQAEVLPRFFGRSSREAREVAAALAPREVAPRLEVVTAVARAVPASAPVEAGTPAPLVLASAPAEPAPVLVRAHEPPPTHPARALPRDDAEPLDADLRRLHVTVSRRLLEKLDRARNGLSHALPCATTEQVLEAALDLLLERQARAKALVRRPRATSIATATATATATKARPRVPAVLERAVRRQAAADRAAAVAAQAAAPVAMHRRG